MQWDESVTKTGEVMTPNRVDQDASIAVSGKVMESKTKLTVKEHIDKTWANLTTSSTQLSQSEGITISKVALPRAYDYVVQPLIYTRNVEKVKQDGTEIDMPTGAIKLAYTVDTQDLVSRDWWNSRYGDKPDLALNLPWNWTTADGKGDEWQFGGDTLHFNQMKGLFFVGSDGEPVDWSIEEGKEVTVKARIYNYSFVDAGNVKVKFEAQAGTDGHDWGDRFQVGEFTIPTLRGFQNAFGESNWKYATATFDTTGWAGKHYRFWVTVDPDNEIEEIEGHDLGEDYGNNQGFSGSFLAVYRKGEALFGGNVRPSAPLGAGNSLSFSDGDADEGDEVIVSLWVGAEGGNATRVVVSFYDGNPDEGGELFDIETIPFIRDGSHYYLQVPYHTWGKVGEHEIHAVIHEQLGETDITDNTTVGTLKVRPPSEGLAWYLIVVIVVGILLVIGGGVFAFRRVRQAG